MPNGRKDADRCYRALLTTMAELPQLSHIDPNRILIVAGAARREARASVRPLTYGGSPPELDNPPWRKPRITWNGRLMLYEICLRPRFFRCALPEERLRIFSHELWHISLDFDGSLCRHRRHEAADPQLVEQEVSALHQAVLEHCPLPEVLSHAGEMKMLAWLSRPPSRVSAEAQHRLEYSEADLFETIVEQV